MLRIYRKPKEFCDKEVWVLNLIKESTQPIPIPELLYFDSSCQSVNFPFLLYEHIQGATLSARCRNISNSDLDVIGFELGRILATIHNITKYSGEAPPYFSVQNTEYGFVYKRLVSALDKCRSAKLITHRTEQSITSAFQRDALFDTTNKACLVHGDFHGNNVLISDRCVSGILDYEGAFWACPEWDFAKVMGLTTRYNAELEEAVINGYKSIAAISDHQVFQARIMWLRTIVDLDVVGSLHGINWSAMKPSWIITKHYNRLNTFLRRRA